MADFRANFELNRLEEISANFDIGTTASFDAVFQITAPIRWHNDLFGRDEEDCHPMSAITGLSEKIETIEENISTETQERKEADDGLQTQINDISILARGYIHEQGIASAVWTVQHNLNKYPSVTVVDSSENEIVAEIEYLDKNSVQITMTGASKGRAYLN